MSEERGRFLVKENAPHERGYATGETKVVLYSGKIPNGARKRLVRQYRCIYRISGRSLNRGVFTKYDSDLDVRNGEKVIDVITCLGDLDMPSNITSISSDQWGIEFSEMGCPESYAEVIDENGYVNKLFFCDVVNGAGIGIVKIPDEVVFFRFDSKDGE